MQFLSIFRKTWWRRMFKMVNKETFRCPEGFSEEIQAICFEKMPQIQAEIDKNPKKTIWKSFEMFLCVCRNTWLLRITKTSNKENICRPGVIC